MRLNHARVSLELHELRGGSGTPLLLLHSLFGSSAEWHGSEELWSGPVFALDFCGHGESDWLPGGAYVPELLAADADAALRHLGPLALAGRGIGAYAALLLAGGRAKEVRAALLLPGAGLAGGGAEPLWNEGWDIRLQLRREPEPAEGHFDPLVRSLTRDPRPADYAECFAAAAPPLLFAEDGSERPSWWTAARARCRVGYSVSPDLPAALSDLQNRRAPTLPPPPESACR
jgi:pimeloyl-ACP methyl ester carboxylesterase